MTFPEIVSVIAMAQSVMADLKGKNELIPGVLTDVVTIGNRVLNNPAYSRLANVTPPDSVTKDIADLATIAGILPSIFGTTNATINDIVRAINGTTAGAKNLADGDFAEWGSFDASFNGVNDTVVVGAFRKSGAFAKNIYGSET